MKNLFLALSIATGASMISAAPAQAQSLPSAAANLRYNLSYLYDLSTRVGDYGYALNDLAALRSAADRFSYTLSYSDYQSLRYTFDTSVRSWNYLRSYQYEPARYADVQRDVSFITSVMDRPLPPPPPGPRVITVTGEGSGGTSNGDREGACSRATERSLDDVAQACSAQRGNLLNSSAGSCSCHRKPGSRDDYTCRVQSRGSCEIFRRF